MKTIAIVSGGMDSITLVYYLKAQGHIVDLMTFNYGQRHRREINAAHLCADDLGLKWNCVDLTALGYLLKGNALSDNTVCVPEGHYADVTMKSTVVHNRNAVMLSCAVAVAAAREYDAVVIGVHSGDHFIYPDCRPEFIAAFQTMTDAALGEWRNVQILAPFIDKTKAQIVALGAELGVPFADTWSCYNGGSVHCGKCGTCVERKEAFALAGITDPTVYG